MMLTWVFRVLFVPLLVLAIITSNCNAARAVDSDSGARRVDVAGQGVNAPDDGTEFALVVRVPVSDTLAFDVRLGYLWGHASRFLAEVGSSKPDDGVCFDIGFELRSLERASLDAADDAGGIHCSAAVMAAPGPGKPPERL